MSVLSDKFRTKKLDQSPYLFHFTKGTMQEAGEAMYSIIESQSLISKKGYISFTASPITSLKKFFETPVYRTGLPMYQPIGIGFSRDLLVQNYGARNVIYCSKSEYQEMPEHLLWRTERLDVDEYDFEYLREWRIQGEKFDFYMFPKEHIIIIAPTKGDLNNFVIKHDMIFNPVVDYINGDIEPDWDEIFVRNYKGLTMLEVAEKPDDYAVSASTITQILGEDMTDEIFGTSLYVSRSK